MYKSPEEIVQPARNVASKTDSILSKIKNWQRESSGMVSQWETNQEKWYKLRMRVKKAKNYPFPDSSNIRMPTLDTLIKKSKSALTNTIYGIRPIVQVIPGVTGRYETALKIEKFLDHMLCERINLEPKSIIIADQTLQRGFYLAKPYWRLETTIRTEKLKIEDLSIEEAMQIYSHQIDEEQIVEMVAEYIDVDRNDYVWGRNYDALIMAADDILSGAEEITINVEDIIYNAPDVSLVPPERFYVPTTAGYNPKELRYGIHEFFKPLSYLKHKAKLDDWSKQAVDNIAMTKDVDLQDDKMLDTIKDMKEGIERLQAKGNQVKIWECYCWYDLNGDGVDEKCVITIAPDFNEVLRKTSLPHFSGNFPIVKFFSELIDDRWFSHRGLPEVLEDIVKEIDVQHMQKIDNQTMRNSNVYLYRAGAISKNATQMSFGQGLPVHGLQSFDEVIKPLERTNPNAEFSYEREQQILEGKLIEFVGQQDYTLSSMVNRRQPRTAQEVAAQQNAMASVFSMDAKLFAMQHKELFNWVWELWCQYGDDEYEFAYFGQQGWERIRLTKEEIQGKYKITVRGNDANTNKELRIQKAELMMQSMSNPMLIQTGIVTPQNLYNAQRRFYQYLDIENVDDIISPPQPPQPQADEKAKPRFKDLKDGEAAQVLSQMGIKPDMQSRIKDKNREIKKEKFEQLSEVADLQIKRQKGAGK